MAEAENDQNNEIWWDLENCGVPRDMDAQSVLPMIEERLWREGYIGPLRSVRVFVRNKESVPPWVLERLDNLVEIHFINDLAPNSADIAIKRDIALWLNLHQY